MADILKTELPHHVEAFERYWDLGDRRTYALLSQETGTDVDTIKLWGRSFAWVSRIRERQAEAVRQIADKHLTDQIELTERNLKIVRAALMRLAKAIANGDIKPRLSDLERLVRLEEHLIGLGGQAARGPGPAAPGSIVRIYLPDNGRGPDPPEE